MNRLLHSAKFWTFIASQGVSLVAFFVGKYAGVPIEDIVKVVGFIDGLAGVIIAGIFVEDAAQKLGASKQR